MSNFKKSENLILGFDVSNNNCSVAISHGEQILAYMEDSRPSVQAETLLPLIEQALEFADLEYAGLDYLALTCGPGSFTGIRIGNATAEGILMASGNIKGFAISNFEINYYLLRNQIKSFNKAIILLNAYRGQLYYQEFDFYGHVAPCGLVDTTKATELLFKDPKSTIACTGTGVAEIYDQIKERENIIILPRFKRIRASAICRYANSKINSGNFNKNTLNVIKPLYIRPPDAIVGHPDKIRST